MNGIIILVNNHDYVNTNNVFETRGIMVIDILNYNKTR